MQKLYNEDNIQRIANAIRLKNGTTDKLKVSEMPNAIENLPTGGVITQEEYDYALNLTKGILGSQEPLPYTPIEYIESTGSQWIDTEYTPNINTSLQLVFSSLPTMDRPFLGAYSKWDVNTFLITRFEHGVHCYFGTPEQYTEPNNSLDKHTIFVSSTEFNVDGTIKTINNSVGRVNTNLTVFKGGNKYGNYRLKSLKVYDSNVLVRDFIPVLDKNNIACLYDKENKKFYYNSGTGNFIAGGVINE